MHALSLACSIADSCSHSSYMLGDTLPLPHLLGKYIAGGRPWHHLAVRVTTPHIVGWAGVATAGLGLGRGCALLILGRAGAECRWIGAGPGFGGCRVIPRRYPPSGLTLMAGLQVIAVLVEWPWDAAGRTFCHFWFGLTWGWELLILGWVGAGCSWFRAGLRLDRYRVATWCCWPSGLTLMARLQVIAELVAWAWEW